MKKKRKLEINFRKMRKLFSSCLCMSMYAFVCVFVFVCVCVGGGGSACEYG